MSTDLLLVVVVIVSFLIAVLLAAAEASPIWARPLQDNVSS